MLSYIIFCFGLLYVQAERTCTVRELIDNTNELLKENFDNCSCSPTNSCLCLPISWTDAELPCIQDGFKRMNEILEVDAKVGQRIFHVHRLLKLLQRRNLCRHELSYGEACHATAEGNVKEFLTVVQSIFQRVGKEGRKK